MATDGGQQESKSGGGCGGGCIGVVLGLILGGIVGMSLPIQFERMRTGNVEAVRLTVLGVEMRKSAGPPGELDRAISGVRTTLVLGLGFVGALVVGGLGAAISAGNKS